MLILCVFLGFLAIGIGEVTLTQFSEITNKQKSINKFEEFVELATETCYGELERKKEIKLGLKNYKISIEGKLIQLKDGEETIKSDYLPLPFILDGKEKSTIRNGVFLIKLVDSKVDSHSRDRLILKLTRR